MLLYSKSGIMNKLKDIKQISFYSVIFLSILIFISCATNKKKSPDDFTEAPLFGMVYDYDNRPCSEALIIIDDNDEVMSDINGRFIIGVLSRGNHIVTAKKEGYETLSFSFSFLNRTQVLYLRMISFHQLLVEIENAIEKREWNEVESLNKRAEEIKKDDPIQQYLKAVYLNERGHPEDAVRILLDIIKHGLDEPVIYLTVGDIYQYKLNNTPEALKYIDKYLELESDREVRKRYDMLKEEIDSF